MPQDPFLYSTSIRENVFFPSDLDRLIDDVQMTDEIERFERGMETVVGERGVTLSGGQKQRLTLARALSAERACSCSTTLLPTWTAIPSS